MKNKLSDGNNLSIASESYGGKKSGQVVQVGRIFGVCGADNPAVTGQTFEAEIKGVFNLPKLAEGITQGARLYWNGAAVGASITGTVPIGVAAELMTTGQTTGPVLINVGGYLSATGSPL